MEYEIDNDGLVSLRLSADEVLTLRHCVIESLEALGEVEFLIRTGGPKVEAEELLTVLKRVSVALAHRVKP
ncbi:hypothetical protein GCM10022275_33880 [Tessaracoccus defluvii]